jgi:hypothetical protein
LPSRELENLNPKSRSLQKHENNWNVVLALLLVSAAFAAEDVVSAVHGTIKKVDAATKTIVVKTVDGTEHSLHFLDKTAVHGVDASEEAAKDSWHGLKEGTEVVAHYTTKGTEDRSDYSTLAFLDEFHGHVAQLGIDPASSQQWPPIVKIDLHGSPHGDPSGNRKALSHDGSPSASLMP